MILFARHLTTLFRFGLRRNPSASTATHGGAEPSDCNLSTVPLKLKSALSDQRAVEVLRIYLAAQPGGENLEFLLDYRVFLNTRNALQRFVLLHRLVHRFLMADAARSVHITDNARRWVLQEWDLIARASRVPTDMKLPALEACARYIDHLVLRQSARLADLRAAAQDI